MTEKTITVKLTAPMQVGEEKKTELVFQEPSLGDLIEAEEQIGNGGQHKLTSVLMARMSGLSLAEIGSMSLADYRKCDAALKPFLGNA